MPQPLGDPKLRREIMFINVPRKPEETINSGEIAMEILNMPSMPDMISAHISGILLDKQIGKSYDSSFFKTDLAVKKIVCQCE